MKFVILGSGSSMGVPRTDGFFGRCDPKNKKNYRTRCSAILKSKLTNILFDSSPDLRSQLLMNKITKIDSVLYTHMHADQTHGINDLRVFYLKNKKKISVFADYETKKSYSFTLNLSDGTETVTKDVTINITNVAESQGYKVPEAIEVIETQE